MKDLATLLLKAEKEDQFKKEFEISEKIEGYRNF